MFVVVNNALYLLGIGLTLYALRAGPLEVFLGVLLNMVLFFYAVRQTFGLGQMNGLVVCLLAVALMLALQQRDGWSGAVIAGAAVLKVSPILLLGYFIARQRWRAVWGASGCGWRAVCRDAYRRGRGHAGAFCNPGAAGGGTRQCRLPIRACWARCIVGWRLPRICCRPRARVTIRWCEAVWVLLSIGVGVITLWFVARAQTVGRAQNAVGFSIFIVAGLLIGGLSWDHYLLWLSVPICALIVDWFRDRWLKPTGFWAVFLTALALLSIRCRFSATLPVDWAVRLGAYDMGPGPHVGHDVVAFTEPAQGGD